MKSKLAAAIASLLVLAACPGAKTSSPKASSRPTSSPSATQRQVNPTTIDPCALITKTEWEAAASAQASGDPTPSSQSAEDNQTGGSGVASRKCEVTFTIVQGVRFRVDYVQVFDTPFSRSTFEASVNPETWSRIEGVGDEAFVGYIAPESGKSGDAGAIAVLEDGVHLFITVGFSETRGRAAVVAALEMLARTAIGRF